MERYPPGPIGQQGGKALKGKRGCGSMDSPRAGARGKRRPLGGSAGLVVAVVLLATLVVALVGWASLSGRLASLQYTNIPVVHPYPPPGRFVNPYTRDPRDLVSSAEAAKVKKDLLDDGQIQVDALAHGDTTDLPRTATGNYLAKLTSNIKANNARGVLEQEQHHLDSLVVGRLQDPANASVQWCVEERGSGVITYVDRSSGRVVSKQDFRSVARFWLVLVGDRYLVADSAISSQPRSAT
jgi:hypothetical protein